MKNILEDIRSRLELLGALHGDLDLHSEGKKIFRRRDVLEFLRPVVESAIADYLPGFQFRDLRRLGWHLTREKYFVRYLEPQAIPPKYFVNWWMRRFLVSSQYDYLSEIAATLQSKEAWSRGFRQQTGKKIQSRGWKWNMRQWMDIEDVSLGYDSLRLEARPWSKDKYNQTDSTSDDTLYRWAKLAKKKRAARASQQPPNHWQIVSIHYNGGQLYNVDEAYETVALTDTGYAERWAWVGADTEVAPKRRTLTCIVPAARDIWRTPDHKFKLV